MTPTRWQHVLGALVSAAVLVGGIAYINTHSGSHKVESASRVTAAATIPPNLNLSVGAWLPWWEDGSGLTTFREQAKSFDELQPFSFQVTSATAIGMEGKTSHNQAVQSAIAKADVHNIPTLTETLNTADFSALINDPTQRSVHANAVCRWVIDNHYDGVDIDYEQFVLGLNATTGAALAPSYTALMKEMADCLHHDKKELQVTVLPRTGDPRYAYFENHLAVPVFDYSALGGVVDYINPMAYDFSYPGSAPGSVDPIEWVKAVIKYTTDRVKPSKVNIALPLYGYNWVTKGTASTASNSVKLAEKYNVTPTRDLATQSLVFTFTDSDANNHTVWYDDAQATALRVKAAQVAGVHGVLFWTVGNEVPGSWTKLFPS